MGRAGRIHDPSRLGTAGTAKCGKCLSARFLQSTTWIICAEIARATTSHIWNQLHALKIFAAVIRGASKLKTDGPHLVKRFGKRIQKNVNARVMTATVGTRSDGAMIIAVDPGGTTGYAWTFRDHIDDAIYSDQASPQEFLMWAHAQIGDPGGIPEFELVVERFTITQRTIKASPQHDALEVIGALRYLMHAYRGAELVMQQPADVMRLFTDDRLKELGWYVPGKVHANDALRHLGYRLARRGFLELRPI